MSGNPARWKHHHTFAPLGRPTGNSIVELFICTLKERFIWLRDWVSADELRTAIAISPHQRPYQTLKWQTPIERHAERLAAFVTLAA